MPGYSQEYLDYMKTKKTNVTSRLFKSGDKVKWTDPDDGTCSDIFIINFVEYREDSLLVSKDDGSLIECFASELELL